ncbi:MAG: hypothetical protein JXO44_05260 [Clostridia bacterium]|nr:hypothetical protein [Clostridia bacterium]
MIQSYEVVLKLIDRFDYGGALEILQENDMEESDVAIILDSCRYAINFDFHTARYLLNQLTDATKDAAEMRELKKNLEKLIDGDPLAIFSELIENIEFQIVNEEYIDFLGRVYRFKEAILKYMFVKTSLNKTRFSFHLEVMSKRSIIKSLRKHYKIYNTNLVYGLSSYFKKYHQNDYAIYEVLKIINSDKMDNLIELRNGSIVGHGFVGVSVDEIYRLYGNPYNVIDDFRVCLQLNDLRIERKKYVYINEFIAQELEKIHKAE